VLDVPIDEEAYTRRRGLDRVVFGVTAVIAVAFLLWGFLSTSSLADVSGNALAWTMDNTGWLFVLT
jgi:choline-glycine betaine transporter